MYSILTPHLPLYNGKEENEKYNIWLKKNVRKKAKWLLDFMIV